MTFQNILELLIARYRQLHRNHGLPYITHPLEVMSSFDSLPMKLLGLVHDFGEFGKLDELSAAGLPEALVEKAKFLVKTFPSDVTENDPRYQDYIWSLIGDRMLRDVKYFDLATNKAREESPLDSPRNVPVQYLNTQNLLEEATSGKLWFYSKSFAVNIFSNFYMENVIIDGESWKSVEHYYQAQKFIPSPDGVVPDKQIYSSIRNAPTAEDVKTIADASMDEEQKALWNQTFRRFIYMTRAIQAKFAVGTLAYQRLQQTGDLTLIHESKDDHCWGCNRNNEGDNILGKMLMAFRNGDSPLKALTE